MRESGWQVTERSGEAPVAVAAKHVCLLFRRFVSWQSDVTRPYVEALEARGIPHVLVGGKAFHEREEVEAIRAALAAVEWPDDELSVFATLRGPFFAVGDEALLEWTHRFGTTTTRGFRRQAIHPFRVPAIFDGDVPAEVAHLRPVAEALAVLKRLHRRRNYVPVAETLARAARRDARARRLRAANRRRAGARQRASTSRSWRASTRAAAASRFAASSTSCASRPTARVAAEAPILEEDSDGVRMMTVHKAKGLEFPIVILADLTCKLSRAEAGRWIDPEHNVCALKLGGWAPIDLLLHDAEESARDRAEGERLAYVAATRARDLLVVPTIGDAVYDGGWLDPLMPAIYPPAGARRHPAPAPGCPAFPSKDSVLTRGDGDPATAMTVAPGMFEFGSPAGANAASPESRVPSPESRAPSPESRAPSPESRAPSPEREMPDPRSPIPTNYRVVWWDPHALALQAPDVGGLRRDDLIAKDGDQAGVERRLAEYRAWQAGRAAAVGAARVPGLVVHTATDLARDRSLPQHSADVPIEVIDLPRVAGRPFGPRFGSLVHASLATVAFDADRAAVRQIAQTHARMLLADDAEVMAAAQAVSSALAHPLFERIRAAAAAGRCARECPVLWRMPDGSLVEGAVDIVFEDDDGLTVMDFKTDREPSDLKEQYERQLTLYCRAFAALRGTRVRGVLVRFELVQGSRFRVQGSGSGFKVQGPGSLTARGQRVMRMVAR